MFVIPNIEAIAKKRTEKDLTQHQLSIKSELPGNAIYRIENGIAKRTSKLRANQIAKALDCKTSDIFIEIKKDVKKVG